MHLQNLQAELVEAIFSPASNNELFIPSEHMIVYKNNITNHLINALKDCYPLIIKLVGEDFFRVAAKEYIEQYPSCSGNLHEYGEYFSEFLLAYLPNKEWVYLPEVAQFEWICHQLYSAADYPALEVERLGKYSPDEYEQLQFLLHPASQLIKFYYPLLDIIALCKGEIETDIDVTAGGVQLLIIRRDLEIMLVSLTPAEFVFLQAIAENKTLAVALANATQVDASFKLEEKLPLWIQNKTIVDIL